MKKWIILLLIIGTPLLANADTLSQAQIQRVKTAKGLLGAADPRTAGEIGDELSKGRFTEENLQIFEAIAQTYRDMVVEYNVGPEKKEWLHSMILLNMAYFQFGGSSEANDTGLNIMIRRKLKQYLSPELLADPNLFYSLE